MLLSALCCWSFLTVICADGMVCVLTMICGHDFWYVYIPIKAPKENHSHLEYRFEDNRVL